MWMPREAMITPMTDDDPKVMLGCRDFEYGNLETPIGLPSRLESLRQRHLQALGGAENLFTTSEEHKGK
jgi:hypothetical protein